MNKKYHIIIAIIALFLSGCTHYSELDRSNATPEQSGQNSKADNNDYETPSKTDGQTNELQTGKKLDLKGQDLIRLPDYVFKQSGLEELDISNNNIGGAIQAEIRHLNNLRVLKASSNKMTGVPAEIGQLAKLEILDLSNNLLTGLPYELGNLKNLKTLDISGNDYSQSDLDIIEKNLPDTVNIIK